VAGLVGCALLPTRVASRSAERPFMGTVVAVGCLCCLALGLITPLGLRGGALVLLGFVLLPSLPIVLSVAERLAGPLAGTAGAIVWMAGNLGGLAVALVVQLLVHHATAAFLTMAGIALLGLPLTARLGQIPRS
jgi:hypothetical protein